MAVNGEMPHDRGLGRQQHHHRHYRHRDDAVDHRAQKSALIGLIGVKFISAPTAVAATIVA